MKLFFANTEGAWSVPNKLSLAHCSPKSTVPDFSSCFVLIGSGFLSQPTHPLHYCHHPVSCSTSLLSVSIIIPAYNNYTKLCKYTEGSQPCLPGSSYGSFSPSHSDGSHSLSIRLTQPPQPRPARLPPYGSLSLRSRALPSCHTHIHTALSCHSEPGKAVDKPSYSPNCMLV